MPLAPVVKITGKKKRTTSRARLPIKGAATDPVDSVTYRVGRNGPFKIAIGTVA